MPGAVTEAVSPCHRVTLSLSQLFQVSRSSGAIRCIEHAGWPYCCEWGKTGQQCRRLPHWRVGATGILPVQAMTCQDQAMRHALSGI